MALGAYFCDIRSEKQNSCYAQLGMELRYIRYLPQIIDST
jgi:hypothetical protein